MKIHFVDGPLDGISKNTEGEPPTEYFAPSLLASSRFMPVEDMSNEKAFMFDHRHRYVRGPSNPATQTVVYWYIGTV